MLRTNKYLVGVIDVCKRIIVIALYSALVSLLFTGLRLLFGSSELDTEAMSILCRLCSILHLSLATTGGMYIAIANWRCFG